MASESFGPVGNTNGKVLLNGPYANIFNDIGISFFGVIIIAAIFGTSILRDFQRDTIQILFTKPISKFAYLGGRWAGSFVATVFAFCGLLFGEFFGTFAPWADHARIGPNHLGWYLQPFFSIVVFQIFFLGSLFFLVAALSRKIFIVYLQGAAIFMLYLLGLAAFNATRSLEHFWSGILDPVGFLYTDAITRYWTVVERNTLLYSWSPHVAGGVFLYNRLLWGSVGVLSLVALWKFFPMSVEALTTRSFTKRAALARAQDLAEAATRSLIPVKLPRVHRVFGPSTTFAQLVSLTRLRISNIVREVPFWGILILMAGVSINNGHYAGRVADQNVWPVTYLMLQAVEGIATFFFFIIATLYAAELLWRERDTAFAGIHDALPFAETTDWFSKLFALCFVEFVLLTVAGLCGILMQTIAGYYNYELAQYAKELYLIVFPQVLTFSLLALLHPDRRFAQVHRPRHHHRPVRSDAHPFQLRLGEHALPDRQRAAIHILGHERLRPFRAGDFLVHHILAFDLLLLSDGLHRTGPPRLRRRLARPVPAGHATCPAPDSRRRDLPSGRHRQRLLVFLQRPRPQ